MSPSVALRIDLPLGGGARRVLRPAARIVLGRHVPGAGPDRINVLGRWLGVGFNVMVPPELLTLVHEGDAGDGVVVGWSAGDPGTGGVIRFTPDPPDPPDPPDAAGSSPDTASPSSADAGAASPDAGTAPPDAGARAGRLAVAPGAPGSLTLARWNTQTERFVDRFTVQLSITTPGVDVTRRSGPDDSRNWQDLVESWWRPRRDPIRLDWLSWRHCLALTFRLAGDAPPNRLAHIVALGLQRRGHPQMDAKTVRGAWNRAVFELAAVLMEPDRQWMVEALDVPGLAEYLDDLRAGYKGLRLPSGEEQIRALRRALRNTGRPEWQSGAEVMVWPERT